MTAMSSAPLVSIIIRSVGRPELADALAAVAAQRYARIEVVVVDASGGAVASTVSSCGAFAVNLVAAALWSLTRPTPTRENYLPVTIDSVN